MGTEYLAPTGEIVNETDTIQVLTPFGAILNESVAEGSGSGVPKTTKFLLLGVG